MKIKENVQRTIEKHLLQPGSPRMKVYKERDYCLYLKKECQKKPTSTDKADFALRNLVLTLSKKNAAVVKREFDYSPCKTYQEEKQYQVQKRLVYV